MNRLLGLILVLMMCIGCDNVRLRPYTIDITLDEHLACDSVSLLIDMPQYGGRPVRISSQAIEDASCAFVGQLDGTYPACLMLDTTEFHFIIHPGLIRFRFMPDKWVVTGSRSNAAIAGALTRLTAIKAARAGLAREYMSRVDSVDLDSISDKQMWNRDSTLAAEAAAIHNNLTPDELRVLKLHHVGD